jgi:hypothetical protein
MRQPTVQVRFGGGTVTSSGTTRRPAIVSDGQQNTTAVSGKPTAGDDRAHNS